MNSKQQKTDGKAGTCRTRPVEKVQDLGSSRSIRFSTDTQAVSPVIGVILMVAITVILSAVIGTFLIGLTDKAGDNAPQASLEFEFVNDSALTVTHEGGDQIEASQLIVKVDSTNAYNDSQANSGENWENFGATWGSKVSAGSTQTLYDTGDSHSGETVRIIWQSSTDGGSNTIAKVEWP